MKVISAISAIAVLAFGSPANAQDAKPEADVLAVINTMFEGFAKKDTTLIRGTLHDDVKLVTTVTNREGKAVVHTETMDKFLQGIASAPGKLEEKLFDPEVRVDGNLATVWVRAHGARLEDLQHCGHTERKVQYARIAEVGGACLYKPRATDPHMLRRPPGTPDQVMLAEYK